MLHLEQPVHHCVPGDQIVRPNSINGHHCGTVVQICDGLQDVGDALTSCFRGQNALEGNNGFFSFLGNLLCHCPPHKTSHNISHDDPSPSGSSTVNLPTSPGMVPCANIDAAWDNNSESYSLSNMGWKWSAVIPEGPLAAPLLAVRKLMRNWDSSKLIHSAVGVNSLNVANMPGATCAPSNANWCRRLRETRGGPARHWKDFSPTTATTGHSGVLATFI